MDTARLEARTGWRILHHAKTASTNDDVAKLRDEGAQARVAVVAGEQLRGRGREGRGFASPPGGLYVSVLLPAPARFVPHHVVAFAALCVCDAVEAHTDVRCAIKWPNDIWVGQRKLGGILLEGAGRDRPVVVGMGLNVEVTPNDVPGGTLMTSLADETTRAPAREALLVSLLEALDQLDRLADARMVEAWRERLLWVGEPVALRYAGSQRQGVLEDVDLVRGLLVRDPLAGPVWLDAAHVQDLRRT